MDKGIRVDDQSALKVLRSLPKCLPPPGLRASLLVDASRESRRRVYGIRAQIADRMRLFSDNLMRPLALPFAGGLVSAVVLFSMFLSPIRTVRASSRGLDVPTGLFTEATIKGTAPIAASPGDVIVDVTVDGDGRMVDFAIVGGSAPRNEALRMSIENVLLMTRWTPATSLGQPVAGKVRLALHLSSTIDVKG
ncbi:MAG: energy transducer TonB [Bryobacteraceae bacterium]